INGCIRGFQELARWPKWIPASMRSWTSVLAMAKGPCSDTGGRESDHLPDHPEGRLARSRALGLAAPRWEGLAVVWPPGAGTPTPETDPDHIGRGSIAHPRGEGQIAPAKHERTRGLDAGARGSVLRQRCGGTAYHVSDASGIAAITG